MLRKRSTQITYDNKCLALISIKFDRRIKISRNFVFFYPMLIRWVTVDQVNFKIPAAYTIVFSVGGQNVEQQNV